MALGHGMDKPPQESLVKDSGPVTRWNPCSCGSLGLESEGRGQSQTGLPGHPNVALTLSLRCQHVLFPRGGSWPCRWAGLETAPSEHFLLSPLSPRESGPHHLSPGKQSWMRSWSDCNLTAFPAADSSYSYPPAGEGRWLYFLRCLLWKRGNNENFEEYHWISSWTHPRSDTLYFLIRFLVCHFISKPKA